MFPDLQPKLEPVKTTPFFKTFQRVKTPDGKTGTVQYRSYFPDGSIGYTVSFHPVPNGFWDLVQYKPEELTAVKE